MKFVFTFFAAILIFSMNTKTNAQAPKELAELWEKHHISRLFPSDARHKDLKKYLEQLKDSGLKVEEVGRSYGNREIYQIEWGKGAKRVFLWSQMHGDEPTATSALVDMFAFLQKNRDKDWVKKMEETLTLRAVPMLNPDGADLFQRRNLQSIDINRDAQDLKTPEAQLLKRLRDEWSPDLGFNLHNQNALTTVSGTTNQAAISFLVVVGNPENLRTDPRHERNKRLVAAMTFALQEFIRGHIGRYVDSYNPLAFGDKFSDWGTPVILIETGALHGKDETFLVKMNFIAFLTALNALASGSEKNISAVNYDFLPNNSSGNLSNYIFRRANIVNFANCCVPFTADVALNAERRRAGFLALSYVREIGSLVSFRGLDEYDASEFYMAARNGSLQVGSMGDFIFYKKTRQINWKAPELEKAFPPDAIFSNGRWLKGEDLIRKK